ncbi:uncharacterized protein LOC113230505 [Hyposmocoma kahamanoa]|uniref:uncharacterized protein LOC113230505 n=1 Tax=Hyposmocoma kahamanoa TaxID=1477025 RepID=UPI000E6D7970|nr:uncharacterized protein LOC113230505 [Hyposmocoma kahamanoa]
MVEKDNDIVSLMECTSKPTRKYLLHTAAYTGRTWRRTFVNIGIDEQIIENYLYENPREPIREIRYQILLDWLRNSENATLGYLSANLWENGHRQLVNELASMYREERLNEEPELEL